MSLQADTTYVSYIFHDDGILEAIYKPNVKVDEQVARTVIKERLEMQAGRSFFTLIRAEGDVQIDKAARVYLASPEGTKNIHAAAFLPHNGITVIIGNFIIQVQRPTTPARLFLDRKYAIAWLHRCRRKMQDRLNTDGDSPARAQTDDNQNFSHLFDQTNHMQLVLGPNGHILDVNDATCKRLGYEKGWLVGLHLESIAKGDTFYDSKRNPIPVNIDRQELPAPGRWYYDTLLVAIEVPRQLPVTAPAQKTLKVFDLLLNMPVTN